MTARANPVPKLASRTSSQKCVPSMQDGSKTTFNAIRQRLDRRPLINCSPLFITIADQSHPQKAFSQSPNGIQSP
jgi:hypothetical protein